MKEDIVTCYEQVWIFYKDIPSVEAVKNMFIEEKTEEMVCELLYYYKSIDDEENYNRLLLDHKLMKYDFDILEYDFDSLETDIDIILETENMCFYRGDEIINSSQILLF